VRSRVTATVATVLLMVTACGGDADVALEGDPGDDVTAEDGGPVLEGGTTALGDIVVDGDGLSLYVFLRDDEGEPTCTDACAEAWPPLEGPANAGDGIDEAQLDTVDHPSGIAQVTYAGWPLYHFVSDEAPGDVEGQGVEDVWFVIDPDGQPVGDGDDAPAGDDPTDDAARDAPNDDGPY
jgi:predicted lipoprotein with Yx(FWY)xxD motif